MRPGLASSLLLALSLAGCGRPADDYAAVSTLSQDGFARSTMGVVPDEGRDVKLWGYVDHGNLYGDEGAKAILGDWWSGAAPDASTWRFHLKGAADDEVGHSFAVNVPNDAGRDPLLTAFVADARAGLPTKVFVSGRLHTFDAPTNGAVRTGLYLDLRSSGDVSVGP